MKRYFSGEFLNLIELVSYLKGKYNFMDSVINEYPDIKEQIKKISFYIKFQFKGEQKKIKIKFGPWVKMSSDSFAQWHGTLYERDRKIVLSKNFFSSKYEKNINYLAGVLLHELVHSIDPKDMPLGGHKGGVTIGSREHGKRLGFLSDVSSSKEFLAKFTEYMAEKGIDSKKFYAESPEEHDAWISQIVFELELALFQMDDKAREESIIEYLNKLRQGSYDMVNIMSGVDRTERIASFSNADSKFKKRLLNAIYRSLVNFESLKRTPIKMSVEVPDEVRENLSNSLTEEEYEFIISGMESV